MMARFATLFSEVAMRPWHLLILLHDVIVFRGQRREPMAFASATIP